MIDISASYHYEPDYEDMLAMPTLPIYYDGEYSTIVRNYRFCIRLQRWQREEYRLVHADLTLYRRIRKQHRDVIAYLRAVHPTFGDPGAEVHERIYRAALKRAAQNELTTNETNTAEKPDFEGF